MQQNTDTTVRCMRYQSPNVARVNADDAERMISMMSTLAIPTKTLRGLAPARPTPPCPGPANVTSRHGAPRVTNPCAGVTTAMKTCSSRAPWPLTRPHTSATTRTSTLLLPLIAVIGFAAFAGQKVKNVKRSVAAEKLKRYGSMWQSIYAATWLAGCGLWPEAFGMAVFAILGLLVMTILKEVNGLGTSPVGYRH